MHIAEGFLPPMHALAWGVAAAPFVIHGARAVVRERRERPESMLLLGAAGAPVANLQISTDAPGWKSGGVRSTSKRTVAAPA